eukprot:TRINITY_DN686_c0_g1_i1.p1 TRINITY_DN686_c0_g1~~TRINITY_DN686_c0_g1_i1.p1  ORF type:complete len:112 (-),score=30.95 TRINITY_DN686_c0_g1_i1:133-468(-)
MTEVKDTLQRIKDHGDVVAVMIVNSDGIPIKDGKGIQDENETKKYATNISQLAMKARSVVRDLDPQNDLTFLRIRTKKNEIMVAPDKDFMLVVIQDPSLAKNTSTTATKKS